MIIAIQKPPGITSHDVIYKVRKITKEQRVGHAGTLDPFAQGVLIVGITRESTKTLDQYLRLPKEYETTAVLGATSTTLDLTGEITPLDNPPVPTQEEIEVVLARFLGPQTQIPPMYSAKKVGGKKLYELARKGVTIERKPSTITIYSLELLNYSYPHLTLRIGCSTGTYIRTLVDDIAIALNTHAYCEKLIRTKVGDFTLENSVTLEEFANKYPQ